MEKLLRKDTKFQWNEDCQQGLDTLKEKMVTTPIVVFLDSEKTFHVHVDASTITLGAIPCTLRCIKHTIPHARS